MPYCSRRSLHQTPLVSRLGLWASYDCVPLTALAREKSATMTLNRQAECSCCAAPAAEPSCCFSLGAVFGSSGWAASTWSAWCSISHRGSFETAVTWMYEVVATAAALQPQCKCPASQVEDFVCGLRQLEPARAILLQKSSGGALSRSNGQSQVTITTQEVATLSAISRLAARLAAAFSSHG